MDGIQPGQVSPRTDNGGEQRQRRAREPRTSSLRRLACDECRARKVRCDRQDPPCSRCAKVGTLCRYSTRPRPTASKRDMSQFLSTLDARLKQAEAQLASNNLTHTPQPVSMLWEQDMPPSSLAATSTNGTAARLATIDPFADTHYANFDLMGPTLTGDEIPASELLYDAFASMLGADPPLEQSVPDLDEPLNRDFNLILFEDSPSSWSSLSTAPLDMTASPGSGGQELHEHYFDIFHPIFPIINKARFQAEISQPSPSMEVRLLSYAMRALSALSEQPAHATTLYEHARHYLDVCERQESGQSLANINLVQAAALLTLYEFKRPNFARAWITLARVIRLAKIMGLDKPDSSTSLFSNWGLPKMPPPPLTPAEVEERRRTFWVLYIFDAFASLTTKVSDFHGPILVPLPNPAPYPDDADGSDPMPTLQQVFDSSEPPNLSPFTGNVIMTSLYQACFKHTEQSSPSSPDNNNNTHQFWDTHYRLDKAITQCRTTLATQHPNSDTPLALGLRMNLGAVAIMLHEAMLSKVQRDDLPASLAAEASSKCEAAVTDIVETTQTALGLTDRKKLEAFRQVDRFLLWPVTVAIQVCFRMLGYGKDGGFYIESLRVLAKLVRRYLDPEGFDPGLLKEVDERVGVDGLEGLAGET